MIFFRLCHKKIVLSFYPVISMDSIPMSWQFNSVEQGYNFLGFRKTHEFREYISSTYYNLNNPQVFLLAPLGAVHCAASNSLSSLVHAVNLAWQASV